MTTAIDVFGITISEPVTSVTDWMVTGAAWWLGTRLLGRDQAKHSPTFLWGIGFWLIGLGALLGGISHAFATYLNDSAYFWIWKATIYSIALSVTLALAGTINAVTSTASSRRIIHGLNIAAFVVYAVWMLSHSSFRYVVWHYVPVMIAIASLYAYHWSRHRDSGPLWLVSGVIVTLAGAVIQRSGFTIHPWFNHNDLYHVIQVAGLYLFYRGLTRSSEWRDQRRSF